MPDVIASTIMASALTIADVERIAALAHLELTADEKELFTASSPTSSPTPSRSRRSTRAACRRPRTSTPRQRAERDDEPRRSLPVADALANAPDAAPDAGLFRVPRVIGG